MLNCTVNMQKLGFEEQIDHTAYYTHYSIYNVSNWTIDKFHVQVVTDII